MSKNIIHIVERIKSEFGYTKDKDIAEALGMTGTAFYNHKIRGSIPYEYLSTFCEKKGISFDWLLTGEGEMRRAEYRPDTSTGEVCEPRAAYGDFVYVPQVSGETSAGGGLLAGNNIEMRIAFRKEWIERRGDPRNMSLIRVSGDSMEPTLQSGDLVLVDHGRNFIDPQGGIYAIAMDDTIMIKRLQVIYPAKTLKIISDNNRYEPLEALTDQVKVNGKAIWFGRELER